MKNKMFKLQNCYDTLLKLIYQIKPNFNLKPTINFTIYISSFNEPYNGFKYFIVVTGIRFYFLLK